MAPRPPIAVKKIGNYAAPVDTTGEDFSDIEGGGSGLSAFHPIRSAVDFLKGVGRGFQTKFRQAKAYTSAEPQNALDLKGRKQPIAQIQSQIAEKQAQNKGARNLPRY